VSLLFLGCVCNSLKSTYGVRDELVEGLSDEGLQRVLNHRGEGVPEVELQLGEGSLARLLTVLGFLEVNLERVACVTTKLNHVLLDTTHKERRRNEMLRGTPFKIK